MKPGDHICAKRRGYAHHGIYIGDRSVIHYAGLSDGLSAGPIERCTLQQFKGAASEYIVIKWGERPFTHEETVERAHSRLGEDKYDLIWNNCEHFARWCVSGISDSPQVRDAAAQAAGGLATAVTMYRAGAAARTAGPMLAKIAGSTAASSAASSALVSTTTSASAVALAGLSGGSAVTGLSGIVGIAGIAATPALGSNAVAGMAVAGGYFLYEGVKSFFD
jgi:hypothetical protein